MCEPRRNWARRPASLWGRAATHNATLTQHLSVRWLKRVLSFFISFFFFYLFHCGSNIVREGGGQKAGMSDVWWNNPNINIASERWLECSTVHQMHTWDILANAASGYNAFAFSKYTFMSLLYITTGKKSLGLLFESLSLMEEKHAWSITQRCDLCGYLFICFAYVIFIYWKCAFSALPLSNYL